MQLSLWKTLTTCKCLLITLIECVAIAERMIVYDFKKGYISICITE